MGSGTLNNKPKRLRASQDIALPDDGSTKRNKLMRFEITGTATDVFTFEEINTALRQTRAMAISKRHAFGWSNQPYVVTFAAVDEEEAYKLCDEARTLIPRAATMGSLPSLLPYSYA